MKKLTAEQEQNLRNVVRALRESPNPAAFTMSRYVYAEGQEFPAGTPADPLGHYATREDLQQLFIIDKTGAGFVLYRPGGKYVMGGPIQFRDHYFLDHFGFGFDDVEEVEYLFGARGCNGAKTIDEAIRFIEAYIQLRNAGGK